MSNSAGVTSTVKGAIQGGKSGSGMVVQIIKLPQGLQSMAKAMRLEGQITAQNPANNTITISTEQGDIEVKVKSTPLPAQGQKIEVDIPAGRPPRQAAIRSDAPPAPPAPSPALATPKSSPPQEQVTISQPAPVPRQTSSPTPQNQAQANIPEQTLVKTAQTILQTIGEKAAQILPAILKETTKDVLSLAQNKIEIEGQKTVSSALTTKPNEIIIRLTAIAPTIAQPLVQNLIAEPAVKTILPSTSATQTQTSILVPSQNSTLLVQNTTTPAAGTGSLVTTSSSVLAVPATQFIPDTVLISSSTTSSPLTNGAQTTTIPSLQVLPSMPLIVPEQANTILQGTMPSVSSSAPSILSSPALPIAADIATVPSLPAPSLPQQIEAVLVKIDPPIPTLKPMMAGISELVAQTTTPLPQATITNNAPAPTITAQVTGFTASGQAIVSLPLPNQVVPQNFIVQSSVPNLQLGSQIQMIPQGTVPQPQIPALPSALSTTLTNPLLRGFSWPAFDQLLQTLQQVNPQMAASLLKTLPQVGNPSQMVASAMVFVAAVKTADLSLLLGDKKIDAIHRTGRGSLLNGLSQNASSAAASDTASDWRAIPLPLYWDNDIHKTTLYIRREQDNNQKQKNDNGQVRFVFDLHLSRMGDIQIDGLLKDKRLDLIIRTPQAFSPPMQQTMRQSYSHALSQTTLHGDIVFQGSTKNWIHVLERQAQLGVSV